LVLEERFFLLFFLGSCKLELLKAGKQCKEQLRKEKVVVITLN